MNAQDVQDVQRERRRGRPLQQRQNGGIAEARAQESFSAKRGHNTGEVFAGMPARRATCHDLVAGGVCDARSEQQKISHKLGLVGVGCGRSSSSIGNLWVKHAGTDGDNERTEEIRLWF